MQMIQRRAPRRNVLIAAVAGIIGSGCFGYYQPSTADLEGRRIQLSLTDAGSAMLAPQLGPSVAEVEGVVDDDSAGVFGVSVLGITRRDGQENDWRGERISISRSIVASVKERRFSRARTTLFTVLSVAGVIATKQAFGNGGGANAPGGTPSGPPGGK